jgi:ABC-type phosphate transport system permease subunit
MPVWLIRQASSSGRLEPTTIRWSSVSSRGQAGAPPLIRSTIRVTFIAPSTAVPQASPSPCR